MFSKVLIGVDAEQGGRDAIALAAQLADQDGTTWLVNVFGAGLMAGKSAGLLLGAELEQSRRLLDSVREAVAPAAEVISCMDHSIGHALHVLAERHAADLVVIGASRRGRLGRVLIGNDTIAALNGAPCAVAIAPVGYAERAHALAELGVGYDGSPESERALVTARALADRRRSTIRALTVISLQSVPYGEPITPPSPHGAKTPVDDQGRRLRDLEDVEGDVTYGDPSDELVAFGHSLDLLIVGSRGYGPIGRLMHGSTSSQLARRATCPLLVLPRRTDEAADDDSILPLEVVGSETG